MRRIVIRYVQYSEIHAVLFFGRIVPWSQHLHLAPLPFCSVGIPAIVTHHLKALFRDVLRNPGYDSSAGSSSKFFLFLPWVMSEQYNTCPRVLYVSDLLFGKGVAHDILSQCLLTGLVISGDAVPCINAEPAVVLVAPHERDEIYRRGLFGSFSAEARESRWSRMCRTVWLVYRAAL